MKLIRYLLRVILVAVFCFSVYARSFYLKNGEVLEGEVIRETGSEIELKIKYGILLVSKKDLCDAPSLPKPILIPVLPKVEKVSAETESVTDTEKELLNWLCSRVYPDSGLLESFFPTPNPMLKNQGATYDQALAGLAFIIYRKIPQAERIAEFYLHHWTEKAFPNFYHVKSCYPGLEKISHLGPNSWLGLFMLHLYQVKHKIEYLNLAEKIATWGLSLPSFLNGRCMSDNFESRARWDVILSTENNIDFYCLLRELLPLTSNNRLKSRINKELERLTVFFFKKALKKDGQKKYWIYRGAEKESLDTIQALDTYSWFILGLNPNFIQKHNVNIEELTDAMMVRFKAEDKGIKGFDYTDETHRKKLAREPVVSMEWTFGVIAAFQLLTREGWSRYQKEAEDYMKEMEKGIFYVKPDESAIAYATRPDTAIFSHPGWWKTPSDGIYGNRAGSVASVAWYLFCKKKFNPFVVEN